MNRYTLHETFVVDQSELDIWKAEPHSHNYFEIIFIENGKGFHTINDSKIPYKSRDIFLLAPEDTHHFDIQERTRFTCFKFTELLFSNKINLPDRKYWLQRIEQILHRPNILPGDAIFHEEDRNVIWDIQKLVMHEFRQEQTYHREIISNAISTILSLIVRNISESYEKLKKDSSVNLERSKIDDILSHIHQNIYNNDVTKINYMANKFNMSQSSISTYFKKQTGDSIHQYITKYKMKLVKHRLLHTDFTIAEIAYQLGYTDESHLTKTFKKHFASSPKQFRKEALASND